MIGWSYDAAGNLLSDGTSTRSYDALNRLVAQAGTSYTYNGDGVLVSDGTTTYAQDLAAPLSQVLTDGTANYVYGHDRLRALSGPWYVGDALGSVRQTLDDAGGVLGSVQYDPWGVPTAGTPQPFGFTGELHSAGQVYLRARWYAPGQGRFVSEDPFAGWAEMPYSLHAYQYAYSNPVRWTDPTGTIVCLGVCIGLLVTGGVIILAAVTHEATRSTQMAGDTMPPLDPSMVIPMPDAATQARNRADFMRGVAYLQNPGAYVWVTPPMDPGPPDPVGYAGPSLQYPSLEDLTVRSPRTGPEEVCVVWPGPSRQASLWPLTTGAPGEQVDAPLVWMAQAPNLPTDPDLQWIRDKHSESGRYRTDDKSYFYDDLTDQAYLDMFDAAREVVPYQQQDTGNWVWIAETFDQTFIGKIYGGERETSEFTIILSPQGGLVTMFPGRPRRRR